MLNKLTISNLAVNNRPANVAQLRNYLLEPVDGASLALFRIAFGLIMLWEVWRYFANGWIARYYIDPILFFSYIPGLRPWSGDGMYWHFYALGLLAVLIAVGLFYRVVAWLFFFGFTYVFLLDKSNYLNHFYLISLISLLLAIMPAQRAWSLDALRSRGVPPTVPRWCLHILRLQIAIVYFYGGIAKLNPDWLRGVPLDTWLASRSDLPLIGPLLAAPWAGVLFAYGGLAVDFSLGALLLWRRTFLLGVLIAVAFNLANAQLFSIGIFPFFMIATLVLFPRPDWPRRILDRRFRRDAAATLHENRPPTTARRDMIMLGVIAIYLLVQLVVPFRHWFYPGDVGWTEEGHRFSWRMKLRDKSGDLIFTVVDPRDGIARPLHPADWLTSRQEYEMSGQPDMILQFAHHVADTYTEMHGVRPQVYVDAWMTLNDHAPRRTIDPQIDLAAQEWTFGPAPWIMR